MAFKILNGVEIEGTATLEGQPLATQQFVNNAIAALPTNDVYIDASSATIEAFVAAHYTAGNEYDEGDIIILSLGSEGASRYVHNGGTDGDVSDFANLDNVLSQSEVRAMLSASDGVAYDSSTGVFTLNDSFVTLVGDGAATEFTFTHSQGVEEFVSRLEDATTGIGVIADVGKDTTDPTNKVKVAFANAPSSQAYKLIVKFAH